MITVCTVESIEYSFFLYYSVNLRSDIYFFRLFCTLSRLFVPFGLDSGFRLLGVRLAVHVHFACLLSGNPKMSNPEPEKKTR